MANSSGNTPRDGAPFKAAGFSSVVARSLPESVRDTAAQGIPHPRCIRMLMEQDVAAR